LSKHLLDLLYTFPQYELVTPDEVQVEEMEFLLLLSLFSCPDHLKSINSSSFFSGLTRTLARMSFPAPHKWHDKCFWPEPSTTKRKRDSGTQRHQQLLLLQQQQQLSWVLTLQHLLLVLAMIFVVIAVVAVAVDVAVVVAAFVVQFNLLSKVRSWKNILIWLRSGWNLELGPRIAAVAWSCFPYSLCGMKLRCGTLSLKFKLAGKLNFPWSTTWTRMRMRMRMREWPMRRDD